MAPKKTSAKTKKAKKVEVRDLPAKKSAKGALGDTATHEVGHWVGIKKPGFCDDMTMAD